MATGGWYYSHQGHRFGPFSASQLKQMAASGQILPTDLVLRDGAERWLPASSVKGLFVETGLAVGPPPRLPEPHAAPARRPLWPWLAGAGAAGLLAALVVLIVVATRSKDGEGTPSDSTPPEVALQKQDGELKKKDPGIQLLPVEQADPKDKVPETKKRPKENPVGEKKADPEPDRRAADLQELLKVGKAALEAKQYAAAEKAFLDASKLDSENKEAAAGLRAARDALALAATQDAGKKEQDQKKTAFRVLLESGLDNLMKQRYDAAIVALTEALKIEPKNAEALAALSDAEEGRDAAAPKGVAKEDRQKKIDAYRKLIDAGRQALFNTRQYDDAITAFGQAQELFPGDRTSATFLQMAQKAKADAAAAFVGQPGIPTQAQKLVAAGRAALMAGDFVTASQMFQNAGQFAPNDPVVVQAQLDFQRALLAAQADADARQRIFNAFLTLLKSGNDALLAQRFNDAIQAASAAVGLLPNDPRGQTLLQNAVQARDAALLAAANAQQQQAENARRVARIQQLLTDGRTALNAKQFKLAQQLFTAAQRLAAPGDPNVAQALQDLATASQPPVDVARQKMLASYQLAMKAGQDALGAQRFGDAVNAFTQASQLVRTDSDTTLFKAADGARKTALAAFTAAQRQADAQKRAARVQQLLTAGRGALVGKNFAAASDAFTKAQQLAPTDPQVRQALRDLAQAQQAAAAAVRFSLSVAPAFVRLARNTRMHVLVTADRRGGYQGAITVQLRGLPVGVAAAPATIPAGQPSVRIDLQAAFNTPIGATGGVYAVGSRPGGADVNSSPFTLNVVAR